MVVQVRCDRYGPWPARVRRSRCPDRFPGNGSGTATHVGATAVSSAPALVVPAIRVTAFTTDPITVSWTPTYRHSPDQGTVTLPAQERMMGWRKSPSVVRRIKALPRAAVAMSASTVSTCRPRLRSESWSAAASIASVSSMGTGARQAGSPTTPACSGPHEAADRTQTPVR